MKKKEKILVIIIGVVAVGFIVSGMALYNFSSNSPDESAGNVENQVPSQDNDDQTQKVDENTVELTNEDGSNPYFQVSNDIVTLSKKVIPDASKIDFSGKTEYLLTLKELNEKYKVDISKFNTESMICNIDETGVLFILSDEGVSRTSQVVCGAPIVIPPENQ